MKQEPIPWGALGLSNGIITHINDRLCQAVFVHKPIICQLTATKAGNVMSGKKIDQMDMIRILNTVSDMLQDEFIVLSDIVYR